MFIKVGSRVVNLDRVCSVDLEYAEDRLSETFVMFWIFDNSPLCFFEEEAEALRAFFNSETELDQPWVVDVMALFGPAHPCPAGRDGPVADCDIIP